MSKPHPSGATHGGDWQTGTEEWVCRHSPWCAVCARACRQCHGTLATVRCLECGEFHLPVYHPLGTTAFCGVKTPTENEVGPHMKRIWYEYAAVVTSGACARTCVHACVVLIHCLSIAYPRPRIGLVFAGRRFPSIAIEPDTSKGTVPLCGQYNESNLI